MHNIQKNLQVLKLTNFTAQKMFFIINVQLPLQSKTKIFTVGYAVQVSISNRRKYIFQSRERSILANFGNYMKILIMLDQAVL